MTTEDHNGALTTAADVLPVFPGVGSCRCTGDESAPCGDPECINTATPTPPGFDAAREMRRFLEIVRSRSTVVATTAKSR